jgi:hypothetical protein
MSDTDAAVTLPQITEPTPYESVTEVDPLDTVTVPSVAGPLTVQRPTPPRDGSIVGARIYTDGHCPLLVDDADIDRRTIVEQHTLQDGTPGGQTVHRYAEIVLTNPTECPTCHKMMERHGLVTNNITGTRDCAIAIAARANPEYTNLFGANAKPLAEQEATAAKHGAFGKRWLKVFGDRSDMPALDVENQASQYADVPRHPVTGEPLSENLRPEAREEMDRARDAAPAKADAVTTDADRKAFELDTLRNAQRV